MDLHNNRFTLQPYSGKDSRHICPGCNDSRRTFSFYIDTATGQPVHLTVGRCDRVEKCKYHFTPSQYFRDNNISFEPMPAPLPPPPREPSFIDAGLFKKTLCQYEANNFIKYLLTLFDEKTVSGLIERYFIGISKRWPGATIFWQIDINGKIRTGKIMLYNDISGSRIKEPFNHIDWVHKLKKSDFELRQCLFGEHLLNDNTKPVAICESEKTSIIASVYIPSYLWLAVGGAEGLNFDKLSILKNRKVVLFPDLGMFEKWTNKANDFYKITGTRFLISDYLETIANEEDRGKGADLADYLVNFDYKTFGSFAALTKSENLIIDQSPINWYDNHLLPSMMKTDDTDNLNF